MTHSLENKTILLVISGGIAAYKTLELIRLLRKAGARVHTILTKGGAQFITPLSVSALSENEAYTDLWSLKDEAEMGHIRLSREADLIVIAPASADLLAKMAQGRADDLASTTLLAANKLILAAPAMNHVMWDSPATQDNIAKLTGRGVTLIGPVEGDMACGEHGMGRMSEPEEIFKAITGFFFEQPLKGYRALVTSGPTYEAIDPVRFLGNRSSGKQGHAIAQALYEAGADVTLISGPVSIPDPAGVKTIHVESAVQMLEAAQNALPADIAVCAAAVSDWRAQAQDHKIKKRENKSAPSLALQENPDILKTLTTGKPRPQLVIGFAAETQDLLKNAKEKLARKGCDWILANEVGPEKGFSTAQNHVYLVTRNQNTEWPLASKLAIARKLVQNIEGFFQSHEQKRRAAK